MKMHRLLTFTLQDKRKQAGRQVQHIWSAECSNSGVRGIKEGSTPALLSLQAAAEHNKIQSSRLSAGCNMTKLQDQSLCVTTTEQLAAQQFGHCMAGCEAGNGCVKSVTG
jgi:hypothetical protein